MFLSAVSVLVVAQPSSEVPDGLINYPVLITDKIMHCVNMMCRNFRQLSISQMRLP
jgi:hypothetical protein